MSNLEEVKNFEKENKFLDSITRYMLKFLQL